jgi:hypothetical protein
VPNRRALSGFARTDLSLWVRLVDRANLMLRLAAGSSFAPDDKGRTWARTWWLSAPDNLRGFYPLETSRLVGANYWVANAELQVPLDWLVSLFIFDYVEGVAALDFGGVSNRLDLAWDVRSLTGVLGVNVVFGPLLLRLHFGHPFDVGGQPTDAQVSHTSWVTNFTLRWFFF